MSNQTNRFANLSFEDFRKLARMSPYQSMSEKAVVCLYYPLIEYVRRNNNSCHTIKVCITPKKMLQLRHCSPVERNG